MTKQTRMKEVQVKIESLIKKQKRIVDRMNKQYGNAFGQSHRQAIEFEYGRLDEDERELEPDEVAEYLCVWAWSSKDGWTEETNDFDRYGSVMTTPGGPYHFNSSYSGDDSLDREYTFEVARTGALEDLEKTMGAVMKKLYTNCLQREDSEGKLKPPLPKDNKALAAMIRTRLAIGVIR